MLIYLAIALLAVLVIRAVVRRRVAADAAQEAPDALTVEVNQRAVDLTIEYAKTHLAVLAPHYGMPEADRERFLEGLTAELRKRFARMPIKIPPGTDPEKVERAMQLAAEMAKESARNTIMAQLRPGGPLH